MKKKITRIWSIGLVVILAASLLLSAAPVSASDLSWGSETIVSTTGNRIGPAGVDVVDLAVGGDGTTMWAVTGTTASIGLYKSTDAGLTWSKKTNPTGIGTTITGVAIAPDDADIVAIIADTIEVYATINGGTDWGDLGTVQTATGSVAATALYDIDISQDSAGKHYIACAGTGGANLPGLYYFDLGAAAPGWKNAAVVGASDWTGAPERNTTLDSFKAVTFSPNFASDQVATAVSEELATAGGARLHMASFNSKTWDTAAGFGADYPKSIEAGTVVTLDKASIALSPDYLGGDDSLRVAFVGASLDIGTAEAGGIYRLKDTSLKDLKEAAVGSIGFDGTNIVAGAWTDTLGVLSNRVYRSADPLASSPTASTSAALKSPGGSSAVVTNVVVAWNGSDVVAGTSGDESAFSVSRDNGKSFNDLSLIDTTLTLTDLAVSADGSVLYLASDDTADFSLWRKDSTWERVLAVDGKAGFIVRIAPEDPDAVYVADTGTSAMYYSSEGGDTKWFQRAARYNVQDMAVESADVLYIAVTSAKTVSKSTNSGFTWGSAKSTSLAGSLNVHTIASLGEDALVVGGKDGYVSYSSDGNSSWTKIDKILETSALLVQVTASGVDDGDFIYATSSKANSLVVRWEIGESTSWKDMTVAPVAATYLGFGIALTDGVLYVVYEDNAATDSAVHRTLSPTNANPTTGIWSTMASAGEEFDVAPSALKTSAGSTKLWAIDSNGGAVFSYVDTLYDTPPALSGPRDGMDIMVNPVSGSTYSVSFSWERPSKGTIYQLDIALDSGFAEKLQSAVTVPSSGTTTDATIASVQSGTIFMPETTYYWRVRTAQTGPIYSPWSEVRTFSITALPEAGPPVVIQAPGPAPIIEIPPAPAITLQPPEIVLPAPPPAPPDIVIPAAPPPAAPAIPPWTMIVIIIIGAVLVIALIVLIMRTRRPV